MADPLKGQRNLKQPYRNKGFQTPYSLVGDAVDPNPPPPSSYSTTTHVATSAHREGLTSPVQQRPVRSRFGDRSALMRYNNLITPWHLYPKADSANIIDRQKKNTGTVLDGASADIFAVYLTDSGASQTGATSATGGTYDFSAAGNAVDGIFSGWTEQYVASSDTDHTDITMPA